MQDLLVNGSDLDISNGDIRVGVSDEMHIEHLLKAFPGEYKQNPLTGIALINYLSSPLSVIRDSLLREIRIQLEDNEIQVDTIEFKNGQIIFK